MYHFTDVGASEPSEQEDDITVWFDLEASPNILGGTT